MLTASTAAPGVGSRCPIPAFRWSSGGGAVPARARRVPAAYRRRAVRRSRLGLTADSPLLDLDPALAQTLVAGEAAGKARIEELSKTPGTPVNGWSSAMHMFDYNLDRCELGTVDTPDWKIAGRPRAYVIRALAARGGLWGNHGYEATYALVYQDGDGEDLDGSHSYELTLSPPPPVDAFWSLTMYDVPDYYLVANPIDRYSIGDRTDGLQFGPDGSLTIAMQHDAPEDGKRANWLPTPSGRFRPVLRMYQPRSEILSDKYILPPIVRVG